MRTEDAILPRSLLRKVKGLEAREKKITWFRKEDIHGSALETLIAGV